MTCVRSPLRTMALILLAAITVVAAAQAGELPLGTWDGGGRTCYGKLIITPRALTWNSAFSRCGPSAYAVLGTSTEVGQKAYRLHLDGKAASCRYRNLTLLQRFDREHWDVIGFVSSDDQALNATGKGLVCQIYKQGK